MHVAAITELNRALGRGDGVVLTSRREEYDAAVGEAGILAGAAVVEHRALTLTDLAGYLPLTVRRAGAAAAAGAWRPVLERLDDSGVHTLSQALSTPLMVALARAAFSDTGADPAELIAVAGEEGKCELVGTALLDAVLPSVYATAGGSRWTPGQVRRWCGFLAVHLRTLRTRDLAWWELARAR